MKNPSIFIVEDDGLIALQLLGLLERAGYTVPEPVESGEAAIEYVRSSRPDLILMDIWLTGKIDGIEAARQIRERYDIPVIFLTAHSDKKTLAEVQAIRAEAIIEKPFIDSDVLLAIGKALGR